MPVTAPALSLEIYQELASLSSQILSHMRAQRWCQATSLCAAYERGLEKLQAQPALSTRDKLARRALLNQILANDAQMRSLMSPQGGLLPLIMQAPAAQQDRKRAGKGARGGCGRT